MENLHDIIGRTRTLTFDCYGTLIDWETGLRETFKTVLDEADNLRLGQAFDAYLEEEAAVEQEPYQTYRRVVAAAVRRVGERLCLPVSEKQAAVVADSVGRWRPFPDTNAALREFKKRFRLGVLSNVDRDLFAHTARQLDVELDFVVTAQDVCSYKPTHPHFERFLEMSERGAARGGWLHVAQSQYHDLLSRTWPVPWNVGLPHC